MRTILILAAATAAASCTMAPQPPVRTAEGQFNLDSLLAGKVARPSSSCVPPLRMNDMEVIDENTIAFRNGSNRTYIVNTNGCTNLRPHGPYTLVTRQFGSMGLCQGDIAQVADLNSHMTIGSCAITNVALFETPGR